MFESTNRLTPAPNKADAFICWVSSGFEAIEMRRVGLRFQASRDLRQVAEEEAKPVVSPPQQRRRIRQRTCRGLFTLS